MGIIDSNIPFLTIFFTIYSGLVWYLVSGMAPLSLLATLQGTVIPLMAFSRVSAQSHNHSIVYLTAIVYIHFNLLMSHESFLFR